jgi:hypothetical protein
MIFPTYRFFHTLSTICPQVIHSVVESDASGDHFSISEQADIRSTPARFDLSNKYLVSVPMMRAGR